MLVDGLHGTPPNLLYNGATMDTISVSTEARTQIGKNAARKIRAKGRIPVSMYRDGAPPTLLTIDPEELSLKFAKIGNPNTLVKIQTNGEENLCLVKDLHRHPASEHLIHVDFYKVHDDQEIIISVPIAQVGRAKGIALGGTLRVIRRTLQVRCLPQHIPATIDIEVSDLDVGEFLTVSQVKVPEGAHLVYVQDFNILTVVGTRVQE